MREKIKLILPILFITFLSVFNIYRGLDFSVTDNTEASAIATKKHEISSISKVENKTNVAVASIATKTSNASYKNTNSGTQNNASTPNSCLSYASVGSISINGRTINIINGCINSSNQLETPTSGAAVYNTRFIYGHNSSDTFGFLKNLSVGTEFSVTLNGTTKRYKITKKDTLTREAFSNSSTRRQVYTASFGGSFDLSIMTCAGTNYGNGDASHRLIIQASRV